MNPNTKVTILFNGQPLDVAVGDSVERVIERIAPHLNQGYVVAVNNIIVPRSKWSAHLVHQDDALSLFQVVAGG